MNSHKILTRKHCCCCYYYYSYKDLLRSSHISGSVQSIFLHSLTTDLLAMLFKTLSLWMTKLRLKKATDDLPMLISLALSELDLNLGLINVCKFALHFGLLLTVSSSSLPHCTLGFTVQRGRMLFYLKKTCSHLNNILSANLLLGKRLLNLTTPGARERHESSLVKDQPWCSGANSFSHPNLSSSSITIYVIWSSRRLPLPL